MLGIFEVIKLQGFQSEHEFSEWLNLLEVSAKTLDLKVRTIVKRAENLD
jgi:hypothetical protein